MILFPNAKINLGLRVTGKRQDGYHNLETIFFPVPLFDVLEIIRTQHYATKKVLPENSYQVKLPGGRTVFYTRSGIPVPGMPEEDLVIKAFKLVDQKIGIAHDFSIHLHKNIPLGAGLGGGSTDAAFALMGINRYLENPLGSVELQNIALTLGSDCPFFLLNKPAFGSGRGEVLEPINFDLRDSYLVILKPAVHISTASAFADVRISENISSLKDAILQSQEIWSKHLLNDFEQSVFPKYPEVKELKEILMREGAFYASMSGSGSSVYGIFSHHPGLFKLPQDVIKFVVSLHHKLPAAF